MCLGNIYKSVPIYYTLFNVSVWACCMTSCHYTVILNVCVMDITSPDKILSTTRTTIYHWKTFEVCPAKSVFKDLCRCHTKKRIVRRGPANPSFDMTPTTLSLVWRGVATAHFKFIVCVTTKEGLAEPRLPILLLVWQRQRSLQTGFFDTQLIRGSIHGTTIAGNMDF